MTPWGQAQRRHVAVLGDEGYILVGPWLRLIFRPWVQGIENIPESGAAILASNHLSFSDSFFLPLMIKPKMAFLAKSDYFNGRGLKGRLIALFFSASGQVPVRSTGGRAGESALLAGLEILRRPELLGVYPEGTRSPDGRLYRGKTGVARMALEAGVPVIPVAMIDTDRVQPPGKVLPRIGRIGIRIGSRSTSRAMRVWKAIGSSSGRSPTRSCTS